MRHIAIATAALSLIALSGCRAGRVDLMKPEDVPKFRAIADQSDEIALIATDSFKNLANNIVLDDGTADGFALVGWVQTIVLRVQALDDGSPIVVEDEQ